MSRLTPPAPGERDSRRRQRGHRHGRHGEPWFRHGGGGGGGVGGGGGARGPRVSPGGSGRGRRRRDGRQVSVTAVRARLTSAIAASTSGSRSGGRHSRRVTQAGSWRGSRRPRLVTSGVRPISANTATASASVADGGPAQTVEALPERVEPGHRVLVEHLDDDTARRRLRQRPEERRQVDDVVQHVVADHDVVGTTHIGRRVRPLPSTARPESIPRAGGARREQVEHVLLLVHARRRPERARPARTSRPHRRSRRRARCRPSPSSASPASRDGVSAGSSGAVKSAGSCVHGSRTARRPGSSTGPPVRTAVPPIAVPPRPWRPP